MNLRPCLHQNRCWHKDNVLQCKINLIGYKIMWYWHYFWKCCVSCLKWRKKCTYFNSCELWILIFTSRELCTRPPPPLFWPSLMIEDWRNQWTPWYDRYWIGFKMIMQFHLEICGIETWTLSREIAEVWCTFFCHGRAIFCESATCFSLFSYWF